MNNPNTIDYWDKRFKTGDWQDKGGFSQTHCFAVAQLPHLGLDVSFSGAICDFGCGAGDSFPVYRRAFPGASLFGVDFSDAAIDICRARYSAIATFRTGGVEAVPDSDVIICSNVLEHVDDDEAIVSALKAHCSKLFVVV